MLRRDLFECVHKVHVDAGPDELGQLVEIAPAAAGQQQGGCRRSLGGEKFLLDATHGQYLKSSKVHTIAILSLHARVTNLGGQSDFASHRNVGPNRPVDGQRQEGCYHSNAC
jgi:hypothetical protein